jgi:hypothetical protein
MAARGGRQVSLRGIFSGKIELAGVMEVVAPFGGRAQVHDFPESPAVTGNGWIEPGVGVGLDVDERTERALRGYSPFRWGIH